MGEVKDLWPDDGPMQWLVCTHIHIDALYRICFSSPMMLSQAWRHASERRRSGRALRLALKGLPLECRCIVHDFL